VSGRRAAAASLIVAVLAVPVRVPAQPAAPAESIVPMAARAVAFVVAGGRPLAAALTIDRRIRLLALPGGQELRAIAAPSEPADVFSISYDGRFVVYGDHKGRVHVWATDTGTTTCDLQLRRYPGVAVFSHDGRTLALTAQGDALQLVDVASCATRLSLRQAVGGVMAAAFSRDDRYIATADGDTAVRVHETADGQVVSENKASLMSPLAVDFARDGRTVLASGGDKVMLVIDAATGRVVRRLTGATQPPFAVQFSADGTLLGVAFMKAEDLTQPDHVVVMDPASGARHADWVPPVLPIGGGWTQDGHFIVATVSDKSLHLWTLK
jgi:WD40 repeat protein